MTNKKSVNKKRQGGPSAGQKTNQEAAPSKRLLKFSPRNEHQKHYLDLIETSDLTFGIGPAGTGKTFVAVAAAVDAFRSGRAERIILVRPVVEAGEKLGFLPGTLQEKIDPYLRPLFDALYDMLGAETVKDLMEKRTIEAAPLAYMRGRTINDAFILADEAQNTTPEQMKMLVTRLGQRSKMVINGDLTQVDLPRHVDSGLEEALRLLSGIEGVSVCEFEEQHVVRHRLVRRIVNAYELDQRAA